MRRLLVPLLSLTLVLSSAGAAVAGGPSYARDTWRSLVAMTSPATGLVADNVSGDLSVKSPYTSPTNIGGYMWSAVVAHDLGLLSRPELVRRVSQTLDTLARLDHHDASGMFYNWYDPRDGSVITTFPDDGSTVTPFLSSVDNGWLAAGLRVVMGAIPQLRPEAGRILAAMNFGFYYNPSATTPSGTSGLIRGGFWDSEPPNTCSVPQNGVWFTCNHYDITVTEPRIATYLGIGTGQIPPSAYFATMRTLPDSCDYAWQEMRPQGFQATHLGVSVYEGSYTYRGIRFVPSWGGDMFEALMPDLFVPEAAWGPRSWGRNHPATVAAQIEHGLNDAGYGYWGFSPASNPFGGYAVYGVDAMGMDTNGYPSDVEGGRYDAGFGDCRPPGPPAVYGDGVVTPHAMFLALPYARRPVLDGLARLRKNFDAYGPGGFYDAVAVRSGTVAKRYLSLDQSMIMGALGRDVLRKSFVTPAFERAIRPLLAQETFNVPAGQPLPQLRGGDGR
ncbi:glucoamylase family protein [Paractinoplanes rishiriensis]|uniref:glucoamylase family protein n=1 Tax=Paractinoplanes rishiriensis TaxID=1050105 RepID=UPI001EF355C4|nr:glucoamylase family protein [Actinoplanes rishiriensis]